MKVFFRLILIITIILVCEFSISMAEDEISLQQIVQITNQIIEKQLEIDTFQMTGDMEIKFYSSRQRSYFNFIYYYHEPDFVHLETKDFVILPIEVVEGLQPSYLKLDKYELKYDGFKGDHQGEYVLELSPLETGRIKRARLWIDVNKIAIKKAHFYFNMPDLSEESIVEVKYEKVGTYSLPAEVQGETAITTKLDFFQEIKDVQKGHFTLELGEYMINEGLPRRVMEKYEQENKGREVVME